MHDRSAYKTTARFGCEPLLRPDDLCMKLKPVLAMGRRAHVTRDFLQDLEIRGLKQELASMHKLLSMLVVMVDPEDVKAAYEVKRITPSTAKLLEGANERGQPEGLENEPDESPW